jgi:YfiH family protein
MKIYSLFSRFQDVMAFTTARDDFDDKAPVFSGKYNSQATKNREDLALKLNIDSDSLVFPSQSHSNCIALISNPAESNLTGIDALITGRSGVCLCIQTADCVPVLLFDPVSRVAAAAHAGWRGTLAGITEKTVQAMMDHFSCNPKNIFAAIGPSISVDVYQTGSEVAQLFFEQTKYADLILHRKKNNRYHLDLWKANEWQLMNVGVLGSNIEISKECSYKNRQLYFSARRDGIQTGRMVSGIVMH